MFVLSTALGEISYIDSDCVDWQNSRELIHHFSSSAWSAFRIWDLNTTTQKLYDRSNSLTMEAWPEVFSITALMQEGVFGFTRMLSVILLSVKAHLLQLSDAEGKRMHFASKVWKKGEIN